MFKPKTLLFIELERCAVPKYAGGRLVLEEKTITVNFSFLRGMPSGGNNGMGPGGMPLVGATEAPRRFYPQNRQGKVGHIGFSVADGAVTLTNDENHADMFAQEVPGLKSYLTKIAEAKLAEMGFNLEKKEAERRNFPPSAADWFLAAITTVRFHAKELWHKAAAFAWQ